MGIKAPFPYFGGKRRIAAEVWERFGAVPNYVEPFAGSLAVLLERPDAHEWWHAMETVNDKDGMISNFWRAVQADPDAVAHWADWPVNENDLHARHGWLNRQRGALSPRLEGDPDYYDARVAGWWVWGICCWIGSGFCRGEGPWQIVDGQLAHLGDAGQGIHRKLAHLGNAGRGIHRQRAHLGDAGQGHAAGWSAHLAEMMQRLSDRLRRVRVCSGDWTRVCGPTPTLKLGLTGVLLDPPYSHAEREVGLYVEDTEVAAAVRAWAIAHGLVQSPLPGAGSPLATGALGAGRREVLTMGVLGERWPESEPPHTLVDTDGRRLTITGYQYGVTLEDAGGLYELPHVVEDPQDPTRLQVAGRWFRAESGLAPTGLVEGIDVASYQPQNLEPLIRETGAQHVVVRLYLGEGWEGPSQAHSATQIESAQACGCSVGGYMWLYQAYSPRESVQRALALAARCGVELPILWIDYEPYTDGSLPSTGQLVAAIEECERSGLPGGTYTGKWVWDQIGNPTTPAASRPLWAAVYNGVPDLNVPLFGGWSQEQVKGHQYDDSPCDRNVFDASVTVLP